MKREAYRCNGCNHRFQDGEVVAITVDHRYHSFQDGSMGDCLSATDDQPIGLSIYHGEAFHGRYSGADAIPAPRALELNVHQNGHRIVSTPA